MEMLELIFYLSCQRTHKGTVTLIFLRRIFENQPSSAVVLDVFGNVCPGSDIARGTCQHYQDGEEKTNCVAGLKELHYKELTRMTAIGDV